MMSVPRRCANWVVVLPPGQGPKVLGTLGHISADTDHCGDVAAGDLPHKTAIDEPRASFLVKSRRETSRPDSLVVRDPHVQL